MMKQNEDMELHVTRMIDATPELVFKMYSQASYLDQWWGPEGFLTITKSLDFRPGGQWKYVMIGPDDTIYPNLTKFLEIDENKKIVYSHGWDDENKEQEMFVTTILFQDVTDSSSDGSNDKTKVSVTMRFTSEEEYNRALEMGAESGLNDTMDHLVEMVTGTASEIYITRTINAERDLVWKVWTTEEHLVNWWGPKGAKMKHTALSLEEGGLFHYGYDHEQFGEAWGLFKFTKVDPPKQLGYVSSFSDPDGNIVRAGFNKHWPLEIQNELLLFDDGDRTHLVMKGSPINASDEEMKLFREMIANVSQGFAGTMDILEEYIASIQD